MPLLFSGNLENLDVLSSLSHTAGQTENFKGRESWAPLWCHQPSCVCLHYRKPTNPMRQFTASSNSTEHRIALTGLNPTGTSQAPNTRTCYRPRKLFFITFLFIGPGVGCTCGGQPVGVSTPSTMWGLGHGLM